MRGMARGSRWPARYAMCSPPRDEYIEASELSPARGLRTSSGHNRAPRLRLTDISVAPRAGGSQSYAFASRTPGRGARFPAVKGPSPPPHGPGHIADPLQARLHHGAPALLSVLLFAIYAATACRTVGPGDSGELTVAMTTWGVAHAPGYPLLMLIGNLVSRLPHRGEPAFILNLLNAGFSALACGVLAAAVSLLSGPAWAGFAAGLALGTSIIFWEYALVTEVFALNALMGALLLLFLARVLKGVERERVPLWPLPASALVMSTVLTHHATLVLLAGPVLVVVVALAASGARRGSGPSTWRRAVVPSLAAALVGSLPLLHIPLAARHDPLMNWGNARDLHGLLGLMMRKDFGFGSLAIREVVVSKLLQSGEGASPLGLRHAGLFWADLPCSFGWLFPVLPLLGLVWAARRARPLLLLGALVLGALVLFFARVNTPLVPLYIGITRPFYILPHLVLAFLGGLGIAQLMDWAGRMHPRGPALACLLVVAGTGAAALPLHWRSVDMHTNAFTRDLGANLIAGMPPGAIVLSRGDLIRNSVYYQQACLGRRPDLALVDQPMMAAPWYIEQLRRRHALRLPDSLIVMTGGAAGQSRVWLDLNLGTSTEPASRPVVAVQLMDDTYASAYRLRAMGLWAEARPKQERIDLRAWASTYTAVVRRWATTSLDRSYPESSWEASTGPLYTRALAYLEALRDIVDRLDPPARAWARTPALEAAERWQGRRRADYLAHQAQFWLMCNADSLTPPGQEVDSLLATRAMELAQASLALDPDNLQALRTIVALLSTVPRMGDPRAEAQLRHRIVQQRPGDPAEVVPYFRVVADLMNDPATRDSRILEQAEADRRRFIRVLEIALKLGGDSALARLHDRWSAPLR